MTLAIRGDRTSSLSLQLGSGTWLLAVARGFGAIGGLSTESALLARLRSECQRRMRNPLFRRAIERPQTAATAMLSVLGRVNSVLHASSASHDDYVTAAASLTAVVVVQRFAYVIHAGATAAYLAHEGEMTPLCADDVMDDRRIAVLARAFAVAPSLDVTLSNVRLTAGDAIVLLGRRIADDSERRSLLQLLEVSEPGDHVLVARFEEDAAGAVPPRGIAAALRRLFAAVFAR